MTLHVAHTGRLTRWITSSSQILLFAWLCACAPVETVDATALRFDVYSDADLSRVDATVLGSSESSADDKMLSFPFATERRALPSPNYLFSLTVELTDRSVIRDEAGVRFDGYVENKLVLRQTVHVEFTDRDTRLVRIWLARTCANEAAPECASGSSCNALTGQCELAPQVEAAPSVSSSVESERESFPPPGYVACGPSDGECPPRNCLHAEDADCPLELGAAECASDAQCTSGNCERGCYGEGCALMRCCREPCAGPCAYCDATGTCQQFVNSDQVANCGACGNVCPLGPHGAPACRAGQCGLVCEPSFGDCMSAVAGCETDLRSDAQHCGSCAGPGAVCSYRQCREGVCLGQVVPVPERPSATATQFAGMYLRRLAMDIEQVLAVGVNVQEVGGNVRLLLLADDMAKPGAILAVADLPVLASAASDAQGVLHGTEYVFSEPISPPGAAFWIGVEPRGAGALKLIDVGDMAMEAIALPATEPTVGATFAPDEVTTLSGGSLGASPFVYAVYF